MSLFTLEIMKGPGPLPEDAEAAFTSALAMQARAPLEFTVVGIISLFGGRFNVFELEMPIILRHMRGSMTHEPVGYTFGGLWKKRLVEGTYNPIPVNGKALGVIKLRLPGRSSIFNAPITEPWR